MDAASEEWDDASEGCGEGVLERSIRSGKLIQLLTVMAREMTSPVRYE